MAHQKRQTKHRYGWKPDVPDQRDHPFKLPKISVPSKVDLTRWPVYDQGDLGSCTANAVAGVVQFDRVKQKSLPDFVPSRLMIYWNERFLEGTVPYDSGATIRDSIKAVVQWGSCQEPDWPYVVSRFADKPTDQCYVDGLKYRVVEYQRMRKLSEMKACLASGFPFTFGFSVYESFESDAVALTGSVPMPGRSEVLLGGHAVMASGYDDTTQRFTCRNSWGYDWGTSGYFTMPYEYLTNHSLAADFWTVRTVAA